MQLDYNKNPYTEQNKQYKNKYKIIKDKNQLNDKNHNVRQLSRSALDLSKEVTIKSLNTVHIN